MKWVEEFFPADITDVEAENAVEEDDIDNEQDTVENSDDADICLEDFD